MRNYREQTEAAYLASKRQGDMVRDRERERSASEDQKKRYTEWALPGTQRYRGDVGAIGNTPQGNRRNEGIYTDGFRGKGPRNYKRSDARIHEMVCDLLCDDPYLDASDIAVEVKNGNVILTDSVEDQFAKRPAEDLAESVLGVVNIDNRIHVNQDDKHLPGAC